MRAWAIGLGLAALAAADARAGVTGVLTVAEAVRVERPGADPETTSGVARFTGQNIGQTRGSSAFGSGSAFESQSQLDEDYIFFKNSNVVVGDFVRLTSRTVVDITVVNDGTEAVRPRIDSTIVPAGFGLYVTGNCQEDARGCLPNEDFPGAFRRFDAFAGRDERAPGGGADIAGATFTFRVSGAGVTLYELTGELRLDLGTASDPVVVVEDIGDAMAALSGFRRTSVDDPDLAEAIAYAWDATPITVVAPEGMLIGAGEGMTFTYETIVDTWSYAGRCFTELTGACITSLSAFGDPTGRGRTGGSGLSPGFLSALEDDRIAFDQFRFELPTFERGVLDYRLIAEVSVPAPQGLPLLATPLALLAWRRRPALA